MTTCFGCELLLLDHVELQCGHRYCVDCFLHRSTIIGGHYLCLVCESIPQHLRVECPICHTIQHQETMTIYPCGHTMCEICDHDWTDRRCPFCRSPLPHTFMEEEEEEEDLYEEPEASGMEDEDLELEPLSYQTELESIHEWSQHSISRAVVRNLDTFLNELDTEIKALCNCEDHQAQTLEEQQRRVQRLLQWYTHRKESPSDVFCLNLLTTMVFRLWSTVEEDPVINE